MVVGTALGFSDWGTVGSRGRPRVPLRLHAHELPAAARLASPSPPSLPIALAYGHREHRDDGGGRQRLILVIPGAMEAGLGEPPVLGQPGGRARNRRRRGIPRRPEADPTRPGPRRPPRDGHPRGPSPRTVGTSRRVAGTFGTAVLVAEALDEEDFHRWAAARARPVRALPGARLRAADLAPAPPHRLVRLQGDQRPARVARVDRAECSSSWRSRSAWRRPCST